MQNLARKLLLVLGLTAVFGLLGCVGLEYPSYWDFDDNVVVNAVTFPFELLITPIIFILKLFPVA